MRRRLAVVLAMGMMVVMLAFSGVASAQVTPGEDPGFPGNGKNSSNHYRHGFGHHNHDHSGCVACK